MWKWKDGRISFKYPYGCHKSTQPGVKDGRRMEINYKGTVIVQQELVMAWLMVDNMVEKNETEIKYALTVEQAGLVCKQMWGQSVGNL